LKFYEDYIEERKYPNFELETEVMKLVLPKTFQTFAEYLSGDLAMMKFINLEGVRGIYINTIRAKEFNIKALLHWCKNEIFNLEKFNIEYDIEVLISRFYIENTSINLDDANLKFISEIIKKQKVGIEGTAEERRVLRDRRQFEILDLCYNFIVKKGQPVKTSVLVNNLLEMYLIVSKQEILKILNSRKDLFTTFGSGYWALSEWKSDGIIGGSIREIVFSLLFNSESPIHLSEILRIISKHRSITLRSLQTNLRFEENKLFKFYNCNFIGLNSKIYDQYWDNLPKVNGTFFQIKVLRKLIEDGFDIPELYEKLYGYPPLNTQFLIDNAGRLR
jgi:hypothetical protein